MIQILTVSCVVCALIAVGECQDMTSLMFQALGMDPPPLPPVMPQTLREHLYPMERQRALLRQKQLQQQKQRYYAYLSAQQQRLRKANPSIAPYTTSSSSRPRPRENSIFSPANMIRQPGAANSASSYKGNPYSISYQDGAARKGNMANPYSVSRASTSNIPAIRNSAVQLPSQAAKMLKTMQTMKYYRDQNRRMTDAKAAGCTLPVDSAAASVLLFSDCRNPASRMFCQAEMMTCINIGMAAMCCPYGMNRLAMDTINYVNKLQHFVSELA